jgi:hypothetical protein
VKAIIRSLIVWVVLLAVPFQGFASAAMLGCAPATPAKATGHHAAMADAAHAHHGTHQMVAGDDAHTPGQHDSKCSNCASCCLGAAIAPTTVAAVTMHAAPTLSVPFDDGPLPSVDPDHPERPPRFERA